MSQYKRIYQTGGYFFFTLVTFQRKPILTEYNNVEILTSSIKKIKKQYPFNLNAMVIMPDHLHCLWKLPTNDADFSTRIRLIKRNFSMQLFSTTNERHEKEIWQRRFGST